MKNITIIALGLMLALTNNHAKAQWLEINSTPSNTIEKFSFITDDIGYALMTNGPLIHKTTDGGTTWNAIPSPIAGFDYMNIDFPKDSVGVIVYRDMSNATTPMMIYQTLDDGATWNNISPASTITGSGNAFVQFIDENIGFMGVGPLLYRTTDGGNNWNTTQIGPAMGYNIQSMDFYDDNNGVIGIHDGTFMYLGAMFVTTDGGQTFSQTNLTNMYSVIGAVDQPSATVSYAASAGWGSGNMSRLYKSTNGGLLWDTLIITTSLPHDGLFLFDFSDALNGVIVVEGINGGVHLYNTIDGGLNWIYNDSIGVAYANDLELTANTGYYTGHINQFFKWVNGSVGIQTTIENDASNLLIYPNPIKAGLTLNWNSAVNFDWATITDLTGKQSFKASVLNNQLKTPNLRPGYYFIKLSNNETQQTVPFIIE